MDPSSNFWDSIVEPYRAGDWNECIRLLRPDVLADPNALVQRHVLAGLYERLDQKRHALEHYEQLLPQAISRGDLLRAIAVQRRIDDLDPKARVAGRYAGIRQSLAGEASLSMPGIGIAGSMVGALLALEPDDFERITSMLTVDRFDPAPRSIGADASSLWLVLYGCMRWRPVAARAVAGESDSPEQIADQYHPVTVDPEADGPVRIRFEADLPSECLHFEGAIVKRLGLDVPGRLGSGGIRGKGWDPYQSFAEHERALIATRPRKREDLDDASQIARDAMNASAPLPPGVQPRVLAPVDNDWFSFNTLSLAGGQSAEPAPIEPPYDEPRLDDPAESGEPEHLPDMPDATADRARLDELDRATPADRRRSMRVAVAYESRIALLGLTGPAAQPLEGRLSNLSETGLGVTFSKDQLKHSLAALDKAVIRLDLGLPGHEGPLRLAGRVRWIEISEAVDSARVGIQFVLLTSEDRASILAAIESAANDGAEVQMPWDPPSGAPDTDA